MIVVALIIAACGIAEEEPDDEEVPEDIIVEGELVTPNSLATEDAPQEEDPGVLEVATLLPFESGRFEGDHWVKWKLDGPIQVPLEFHPTFQVLFDNMVSPLQATMFSLLAFYVASAAYRAFRARNVEATILLVAAIIVMLGRIPFGDMLTGGRMTPLSEWIMNRPNAAAQRGIIIGAALGAASMSIRVILGIERTYLGKSRD